MITNERQYKITRAEADKFRRALEEMEKQTPTNGQAGIHPRLVQAEKEALTSQLDDLREEIVEYERLKSTDLAMISVNSFDDLAEGLIKARIAARLSQKALAERLGLKEQQIQRYEADRYASASYQRMRDIANAIGVRIRNDILLPVKSANFDSVVSKLRQVGLDRDFVVSRLLSSADAARASGEVPGDDEDILSEKAGAALERVYGWTSDNIFGPHPLAPPRFAAAEARFKMPAGRSQTATTLYAAYANYLAVVVIKACRELPKAEIPSEAHVMRQAILQQYGDLSLLTTLNYAWDLGVPVLPLKDRGSFHGACWRYEGRNIIVLKQTSKHETRWLFDLLHELRHTAEDPTAETREVIEADETSAERRDSEDEIVASQFAGDVALDGKAEQLAQACVEAAGGSVERLKGVVPRIAKKEGVEVGALANYLAFRLSWQNINWWGAAANLQVDDTDPWAVARDVFLKRFTFVFESELDRQLLDRALQGAQR